MREKVCVIVAYFGKFPNYFPLWLKSCEANPKVDFLLITDAEVGMHPDNVRIYKTDLLSVKERATKVLGFEATLDRPYKLCDYRPVYGLMFSDLLIGYDYWGHCDVDMIFGDLQTFFEYYKLSSYERFLPLGHLSLYRNNDETNNRFRSKTLSPYYKEVFSHDRNFVFDEFGGMTTFYHNSSYPFFEKRVFADITSIYHRFRLIEEYRYDDKPKNYPFQIFFWENGKCYHAWMNNRTLYREEYIYIHFKKRPNYSIDFDINNNGFYITNEGFVEKRGDTTLEVIKKLNPYKGRLYEMLEYTNNKVPEIIEILKHKLVKTGM